MTCNVCSKKKKTPPTTTTKKRSVFILSSDVSEKDGMSSAAEGSESFVLTPAQVVEPVLAVFGRRLCSSDDINSLWQQHQSQLPPLSVQECCSHRLHLCNLCVSSTTCSLIKSNKACWPELRPQSCFSPPFDHY